MNFLQELLNIFASKRRIVTLITTMMSVFMTIELPEMIMAITQTSIISSGVETVIFIAALSIELRL